MSWLVIYKDFNAQWELLNCEVISRVEVEHTSMPTPAKTEFGRCWWNRDVDAGRSLLSQRAKEINKMIVDVLSKDGDLVCSSIQAFSKVSDVDGKLKNLIKRIDNSIWNWICDLFTGFSRAIKKEEKKLEQLYLRYQSIVNTVTSQPKYSLTSAQIAVNREIQRQIAFVIEYHSEPNDPVGFKARLDGIKTNLTNIYSAYFRDLFRAKISEAERGLLEPFLKL